jgi:hypothetical protein
MVGFSDERPLGRMSQQASRSITELPMSLTEARAITLDACFMRWMPSTRDKNYGPGPLAMAPTVALRLS